MSVKPNLLHAAAESPPPITLIEEKKRREEEKREERKRREEEKNRGDTRMDQVRDYRIQDIGLRKKKEWIRKGNVRAKEGR